MSRPVKKSFVGVVFDTLGWSLLWGLGLCLAFYALVHNGVVDSPFMRRYFAGHPVEYVLTGMFFVGLVAILMKATRVLGQFQVLSEVEFAPRPEAGQPITDASGMAGALEKLPNGVRESYFVRRLVSALDYVDRKDDVADLDEQLKYLAEQDAERQYSDYALVRIIIWATPMLGFLGTVIGITLALANLSPTSLVQTPETAMEGLLASLSVAFDTTALALTLSVILMFCQFIATQLEGELLTAVDRRVESELIGRFHAKARTPKQRAGGEAPLDYQALQDAILGSTEKIAAQQTHMLRDAIVRAQTNWDRVVAGALEHMKHNVDDTLRASTIDHVHDLTRAEEMASDRVERRWTRVEEVLMENARVMREQQLELTRQGDLLLKSIEGAADIKRLERVLNKNLESLSHSQHFFDTLTNLTGAVNMLASRITEDESRPSLKLFTPNRDSENAVLEATLGHPSEYGLDRSSDEQDRRRAA